MEGDNNILLNASASVLCLLGAVLMFLSLASVTGASSPSSELPSFSLGEHSEDDSIRIVAYTGFDSRIYYWKELESAAQAEALKQGFHFVSLPPHDRSVEAQHESLLRAVDMGADGLVVGITPSGLDEVLEFAQSKGTRVVVVNSPSDAVHVDSQVYALDEPGARRAADAFLSMADRPPSGRVLVVTGDQSAPGAHRRADGFRSSLEKAGYKVTVRYTSQWRTEDAVHVALEELGSVEPPVAAFAAFADATIALAVVAESEGLELPIYGYDITPTTRSYIDGGVLQGGMDQQPAEMGRTAVRHLAALFDGETVPSRTESVPVLRQARVQP